MEKEEENAPISPNHLARSATCEVDMNCIFALTYNISMMNIPTIWMFRNANMEIQWNPK